jgi:hypothetical protein
MDYGNSMVTLDTETKVRYNSSYAYRKYRHQLCGRTLEQTYMDKNAK